MTIYEKNFKFMVRVDVSGEEPLADLDTDKMHAHVAASFAAIGAAFPQRTVNVTLDPIGYAGGAAPSVPPLSKADVEEAVGAALRKVEELSEALKHVTVASAAPLDLVTTPSVRSAEETQRTLEKLKRACVTVTVEHALDGEVMRRRTFDMDPLQFWITQTQHRELSCTSDFDWATAPIQLSLGGVTRRKPVTLPERLAVRLDKQVDTATVEVLWDGVPRATLQVTDAEVFGTFSDRFGERLNEFSRGAVATIGDEVREVDIRRGVADALQEQRIQARARQQIQSITR